MLQNTFLTNKTKSVKISNNYSEIQSIRFGVSKGSILGLSLFLKFINDWLNDTKSEIKICWLCKLLVRPHRWIQIGFFG